MPDDNKTIVRRFAEECWKGGLLPVADELVAEDLIRNGEQIGRAGLVDVISGIRRALPDYYTEIEDLIAEGDRVAWRYSGGGSHTGGPLLGIPATGRTLSWAGTAILRIDAGEIREIWDSVDMLAIYTQLGVVSPPGGAHHA